MRLCSLRLRSPGPAVVPCPQLIVQSHSSTGPPPSPGTSPPALTLPSMYSISLLTFGFTWQGQNRRSGSKVTSSSPPAIHVPAFHYPVTNTLFRTPFKMSLIFSSKLDQTRTSYSIHSRLQCQHLFPCWSTAQSDLQQTPNCSSAKAHSREG